MMKNELANGGSELLEKDVRIEFTLPRRGSVCIEKLFFHTSSRPRVGDYPLKGSN